MSLRFIPLLPLALAAAVSPVAAQSPNAAGGRQAEAKEVFDVDIPLLDGGVIRAQDLKGKYVIVDVWGTWCGPCRKVIPHLIDIQRRFADRGVEVIGVSAEVSGPLEAATRRVKEFAARVGINYQLGILNPALYKKVRSLMHYEGDEFTVPTTLVLDRDSVIIGKYPGYLFGQEDEISDLLEQHLAAEARAGKASP